MARPRKNFPRYLRHKASGRGRAVWTDPLGGHHDVLLPGLFESSESKSAFARLALEQEVGGSRSTLAPPAGSGRSVAEVLLLYLEFAATHYRHADGTPTSELTLVKLAARSLRELYAALPAHEFSPLKLKAARQDWVNSGLSRNEVNRRGRIVKRIFRWAASEELVPATTYTALALVPGLQKGRTTAPETEPVRPVPDETVEATLPHVGRHVRALVQVQRLTGMRPGEACALRGCDLDTTGAIWLFRPTAHKTAYRGKLRTIAVGPKAQAVLKPFLKADPNEVLFSPAAAVAELRAERATNRKTKLYPSHVRHNKRRRKAKPKRAPADRYTAASLGAAIDRACDRAFPLPAPLALRKGETLKARKARLTPEQLAELKAWQAARHWNPNQLRHTHGTEVRHRFGLEGAQVALGHEKADVTQVYAERNLRLAVKIAGEVG